MIPTDGEETTFWDHLNDLRRYLIRYLIVFAILWILAFYWGELLFRLFFLQYLNPSFISYQLFYQFIEYLSPLSNQNLNIEFSLINTELPGQFMMHLSFTALLAFVASFPFLLFQLWVFIRPALYPKERKLIRKSAFIVIFLFFTGILFAYFIVTPLSILFLGNYQIDPSIPNLITLKSFFSLFVTLHLFSGLLFLLPYVVAILSRIGIIGPSVLKKFRKHVYVSILIISAVITPTTDPFTMTIVAIPVFLLYEISITWSKKITGYAQNNKI